MDPTLISVKIANELRARDEMKGVNFLSIARVIGQTISTMVLVVTQTTDFNNEEEIDDLVGTFMGRNWFYMETHHYDPHKIDIEQLLKHIDYED